MTPVTLGAHRVGLGRLPRMRIARSICRTSTEGGDERGERTTLWSSFPHDPRERAHAGLRASDAGPRADHRRAVVGLRRRPARARRARRADGGRRRGPHPRRAAAAGRRPGAAQGSAGPRSRGRWSALAPEELHQRAVERWARPAPQRRLLPAHLVGRAAGASGSPLGADGFPWPAVVTALSLLNVPGVLAAREQIVRDEVRRLEKKQAAPAALAQRSARSPGPCREPPRPRVHGPATTRRRCCSSLQLLAVLAYPFLDATPTGRAVLGAVQVAVVLSAAWAVRRTPTLSWVAVLLGGPAMVFSVLEAFSRRRRAGWCWSRRCSTCRSTCSSPTR